MRPSHTALAAAVFLPTIVCAACGASVSDLALTSIAKPPPTAEAD